MQPKREDTRSTKVNGAKRGLGGWTLGGAGRLTLVSIGCLLLMLSLVGPQDGECCVISRVLRSAANLIGFQVEATEVPPITRASRDADDTADEDDFGELNGDFESECLLNRGANLKSAPQVIFFSAAEHSDATLGCTPRRVVSLGLEGNQTDLEGNPNNWRLDTYNIQRVLIDSKSYDESLPSYVLVHGFLGSWTSDTWMCQLKDKILNETEANVFILDWSGGSKPMLPIDYGAAVGNTKYVGQLLAKFILTLLQLTNEPDASKFHLVGHSLGAHIAGFVGYSLAETAVGRITGLDPAGPCFSSSHEQNSTEVTSTGDLSGGKKRLSEQSAQLVVAVHTDAGRFGLNENCGHYDIYVNGGSSPQPNCQTVKDRVKNLLKLRLAKAIDLAAITCAHGYSHSLIDAYLTRMVSSIYGPLMSSNAGPSYVNRRNRFANFEKQCYLEAYRCASWTAFKRGECGLNANWQDDSYAVDVLAINRDLDGQQLAQAATQSTLSPRPDEPISESQSHSQDERANDEDYDATLQSSLIPIKAPKNSPNKHWQHFVKTSRSKSPTCAFTYQIVVVAESASADCQFDVDIPLDKELGLVDTHTGDKATKRSVQVSHKIGQSSYAQAQLSQVFGSLVGRTNQLDYYTALITFDSVPKDECLDLINSAEPKTNRKRWYLCQAISNIYQARLWASDSSCLRQVKYVAMAYLSGYNTTIRHSNSYLFEPSSTSTGRTGLNGGNSPGGDDGRYSTTLQVVRDVTMRESLLV